MCMPFLATWGSMPFMAGQYGYVSQEEQADQVSTDAFALLNHAGGGVQV